jgi:hypothetical protein
MQAVMVIDAEEFTSVLKRFKGIWQLKLHAKSIYFGLCRIFSRGHHVQMGCLRGS